MEAKKPLFKKKKEEEEKGCRSVPCQSLHLNIYHVGWVKPWRILQGTVVQWVVSAPFPRVYFGDCHFACPEFSVHSKPRHKVVKEILESRVLGCSTDQDWNCPRKVLWISASLLPSYFRFLDWPQVRIINTFLAGLHCWHYATRGQAGVLLICTSIILRRREKRCILPLWTTRPSKIPEFKI